nr:hypothetical protein [Armatimonas sp.]
MNDEQLIQDVVTNLILAMQEWEKGNDFLFCEPYFDANWKVNMDLIEQSNRLMKERMKELLPIAEKYIDEEKRGRFLSRYFCGSNSIYKQGQFSVLRIKIMGRVAEMDVKFLDDPIFNPIYVFKLKKKYMTWYVRAKYYIDPDKGRDLEYYI